VAGSSNSFGTCSYGQFPDFWILKLDGNGNVQWQKTYGDTCDTNKAYSVQQTSDGGYIVAGDTWSGETNVWILKLDGNGNVQWQKSYGSASHEHAGSIQQTSDGGYIVAGYFNSFPAGNDALVLKLDSDGNVQWQKTYGGPLDDFANSIRQTSDGGYAVTGYTNSFGAGHSDAWVLKLDDNGSVQWQKTYGGSNLDSAYSIQQTLDGGFIVAGGTGAGAFGDNGDENVWVLKLDGNGENPYYCTGAGMRTSNAIVNNTNGISTDSNVIGADSYVSPQTSTALVANTNVKARDLCSYRCDLIAFPTVLPRGATLGFGGTVTNNTNNPGSVLFGTKVTLPNGNWYPASGYLIGPLNISLDPSQSKSGHKSHMIPLTAPLGTYTYHGYVGNYGVGIYDECTFNFEVKDPIAYFTGYPTTGSVPLTVHFTDGSKGVITSYLWDFGDGGTSTLRNPYHTYNNYGYYSVSLTVTGPGGSDTYTRINYITLPLPY
jgi:hypothetical protein